MTPESTEIPLCPECGKKQNGTCECLDYTVKGFCTNCNGRLLIGDFDNGQCMTCGNTDIHEGLT